MAHVRSAAEADWEDPYVFGKSCRVKGKVPLERMHRSCQVFATPGDSNAALKSFSPRAHGSGWHWAFPKGTRPIYIYIHIYIYVY